MKKFFIGLLPLVMVMFLSACNDATDETSHEFKKTSTSAEPTSTDEVSSDHDEESSTTMDPKNPSLKDQYLQKLHETKIEMDELRENPADESTYALKNAEGQRFDVWDALLNEIYGVLKEQLPHEEMDNLRKEQRIWIKNRDASAKEASLKYEGGTQEHLEYVVVLNNLTEERCFELVQNYMQ